MRGWTILLPVLGLTLARPAWSEDPRARSFTLENGLHVSLVEDHRTPRVAVVIAYKAGFRDEPAGYRGLAHLTEHLMYGGSRHIPADGVMPILERAGALRLNALTSLEAAVFFEEMPRRNYETALWVESDRMAFTLDRLTSDMIDREKAV